MMGGAESPPVQSTLQKPCINRVKPVFILFFCSIPRQFKQDDICEGGQTLKNIKKKPNTGLLHSAPKWKLLYDCNGSPTIPSFLAVTTRRPDIVLYACCIKTVIIL